MRNQVKSLSMCAFGVAVLLAVCLSAMRSFATLNKNYLPPKVTQICKVDLGDFVGGLAFAPDDSMLAAAGFNRRVKIWDTNKWAVIRDLKHPGEVTDLAFSPNVPLLATVTNDNDASAMWLWDVANGKKVGGYTEANKEAIISAIAFTPNGNLLAIGLNTGTVKLLNIENPQDIKVTCDKLLTFDSGISSLSFSPNGELLAVGAGKGISGPKDFGTFKVIEVKTGKEVFKNTALAIIYNLAFSPDGQVLAVAGAKTSKAGTKLTLNLFATGRWIPTGKFDEYPVGTGLSFSKDGRWLVSAFPNPPGAEIAVMESLKKYATYPTKTKTALTALALSSDGKSIAVGDEKGAITISSIELKAKDK